MKRIALEWPLLAIFVVALVMRAWGTSFGLPYDLTADEPHQILQALKIGAGEGGPLVQMWHTVGKGGLDFLLFFEYGLLFAFWWLTGKVSSANDFAMVYLTDPTAFYLLGRLTIAGLGALTCVAVYAAGRHMFGRGTALLAALIGALAIDHATNSHLINVHIPMAAALWAAVWCYCEYERTPTRTRLLLSGVLAGLAISLAYNAVIGLAMLVFALMNWRDPAVQGRARVVALATLLGGAFITILLFSPDLIGGAGALLHNFEQVLGSSPPAVGTVPPPGADTRAAIDAVTLLREQSWRDYLPILIGSRYLPVTLAALVGGVVGLCRRERWCWLLVGSTVLLVVILSASDRGASERYMAPMSPALWLLAARGISALAALAAPGTHRRWLRAALVVAVVTPGTIGLLRTDYTLSRTDTRVLAKQWIETHLPAEAKVLIDGMRFRYIQSPPLKANSVALERQLEALKTSELQYPKRFLDLYRRAQASHSGPRYDLHSTMYGLDIRDLDYYVAACFDYAVVSSDVTDRFVAGPHRQQWPAAAAFYDGLASHPAYHELYRISGEPWRAPGPSITVYAIDSACGNRSQSLRDGAGH